MFDDYCVVGDIAFEAACIFDRNDFDRGARYYAGLAFEDGDADLFDLFTA